MVQQEERPPRVNDDFLKALVAEGAVTENELHAAQQISRRRSLFVEEVLLQMECLSEADMLKYQSAWYKTQFVSTQKLSSAPIDKTLLKILPQKVADKLCVFPVMFSPKNQLLTVLVPQPDDLDLIEQVRFATRVHQVKALVARPGAIKAAIQKHYQGIAQAFEQLSAPAHGRGSQKEQEDLMKQYDQQILRTSALSVPPPGGQAPSIEEVIVRPGGRSKFGSTVAPQPPPEARKKAVPPPPARAQAEEEPEELEPEELEPEPEPEPVRETRKKAKPEAVSEPPPAAAVTYHDYLETLNVLVALHENSRGELRGHSVQVARISRRMCERLGLSPDESDGIIIAAYLHDIGKATSHHLTALNVAEYEAHQLQAQKSYLTPLRMFESVRLPSTAVGSLTHLYERFDGSGFPDRLKGTEIDLGSRIIAIAETYSDLISHEINPFRKKLSSQEACEVLANYREKIFDPSLVDIFKLVVLGEDLKAKLLAGSRRALLADPDTVETTVLELRMIEQGFDVTIARNSADALEHLETGEFDVVISEVDLKPLDGFKMLQKIQAGKGADIPFIFLSRQTGGDMVQKGFELGAADYIIKPASADVVALKIRQVLDSAKPRAAAAKVRGVSGSLEEMGLPDVVQILFHSRKSGKLSVVSGDKNGEVQFSEGWIFNAVYADKQGEEAFYDMLNLTTGHFELDPNFRPTEQLIQASPESLLLEGMRRLDEANR
jgi:response regulator RpfG family c-di-GMP phosphodiesterase